MELDLAYPVVSRLLYTDKSKRKDKESSKMRINGKHAKIWLL